MASDDKWWRDTRIQRFEAPDAATRSTTGSIGALDHEVGSQAAAAGSTGADLRRRAPRRLA